MVKIRRRELADASVQNNRIGGGVMAPMHRSLRHAQLLPRAGRLGVELGRVQRIEPLHVASRCAADRG